MSNEELALHAYNQNFELGGNQFNSYKFIKFKITCTGADCSTYATNSYILALSPLIINFMTP